MEMTGTILSGDRMKSVILSGRYRRLVFFLST